MSAMFVGVYSWAELCLTFVPDRSVWAWWYFGHVESTEARCEAEMWEGSWWGSLWLIFPLATWQGEDRALIMNCDTLMSLSSADNTWSALLPFNLWYQWGKLQANKGFVSPAKTEHGFKDSALDRCLQLTRMEVWLKLLRQQFNPRELSSWTWAQAKGFPLFASVWTDTTTSYFLVASYYTQIWNPRKSYSQLL